MTGRVKLASVLARFVGDTVARRAKLSQLHGGKINKIYLVTAAGGERFVLREYRMHKTATAILYEHDLLKSLPARILTARLAAPIPAADGATLTLVDNTYFALFPFLDGTPSSCVGVKCRRDAGGLLAEYHNLVWDYRPRPLVRPGLGRLDDVDWIAINSGSVIALGAQLVGDEPRIRKMYDLIESEIAKVSDVQRAVAECPSLVAHYDLGPQNLLVRGHEIVGLLDFDLATWELRAFDVAIAIMWFAAAHQRAATRFEGYEWRFRRSAALDLLRGYTSTTHYALSPAEYEVLPTLMRRFCVWLILWHLDRRSIGEDWFSEDIDGLVALLSDMSSSKRIGHYSLSASMP